MNVPFLERVCISALYEEFDKTHSEYRCISASQEGPRFCGIAGYVGLNDESLLKRMIDVLRHRGPDDGGFYVDAGLGVANPRLSVIDLAGGHQPIHNEDGTIQVTYNA